MDTINILLPYGYEEPTDDDVRAAKRFTKERNDNAAALASAVFLLLTQASRSLIRIGYRYSCKPDVWQFSQNKKLRREVIDVMDNIEQKIFNITTSYSMSLASDSVMRSSVMPWLMALSSKGSTDLRSTLHARLIQWLYDTEAQIAAMKLAGRGMSDAITRIPPAMHSVYTMPEVLAAFNKRSAARYIKSKGVHEGNKGLSSSGANNIESFAYQTAVMAWEKIRYEQQRKDGKAGYVCIRGSNFPCAPCDDVCYIFHPIENGMVLPVHPHCCCVAIFINKKER